MREREREKVMNGRAKLKKKKGSVSIEEREQKSESKKKAFFLCISLNSSLALPPHRRHGVELHAGEISEITPTNVERYVQKKWTSTKFFSRRLRIVNDDRRRPEESDSFFIFVFSSELLPSQVGADHAASTWASSSSRGRDDSC